LPKNIPAEALEDSIKFGGLYVDDNLIVWSEGERGAPDNMIYQATDEARKLYPDKSLADMYGENMYLYPELLTAHQNNDRAVMQAYGFPVKSTFTESQCVAELFKLYKEKTK